MSPLCKPRVQVPPVAFAVTASCNAAMTVPLALRDRHLRRFSLRRHRLHVAGGTLSMVTPSSSQSLLHGRGLERYDFDKQIPYWAELWPASVGIARLLMRGPGLSGRRVLDLGCGLGLAGIAAGRRGAEVVFADREEEALRFCLFNASQNGVAGARAVRLDWDEETVPGRFDLICLADVAYEERNHEPLLRHLSACLAPRGRALFGDPYRESGGVFLERVARDFAVELVETDTFFGGRRTPLRIAWVGHP